MTIFKLNPDLDRSALAAEYAARRRVRIHNLLARDTVDALYAYLNDHEGWWQLMIARGGILELDRRMRAEMKAEELAALDTDVHGQARFGFQYRYEGLRVPDDEESLAEDDPLTAFAHLMSSEPMLDFLRDVTGSPEIAFTDGQATAYGPGDFLTGHDDDVPGKDRIAAYVFGLTPQWRPEWGGVLLFHEEGEERVAGHVPRYNVLDLFAVPQRHSVSIVTPAAPARRYAVTGWLRSRQAV